MWLNLCEHVWFDLHLDPGQKPDRPPSGGLTGSWGVDRLLSIAVTFSLN